MVALGEVDRLEDEDIHRVLDLAVGVAGRELDIGDDRVSRIRGVDLAVGFAAKLLVRADIPNAVSNAGDSLLVISIRMMRASAIGPVKTAPAARASAVLRRRVRRVRMAAFMRVLRESNC